MKCSRPCSLIYFPHGKHRVYPTTKTNKELDSAFLQVRPKLAQHKPHSVSQICLEEWCEKQTKWSFLLAVAVAVEALGTTRGCVYGVLKSCRHRVSSPCPSCGQALAAQVPSVPTHSLNLGCKPVLSPHLGQIRLDSLSIMCSGELWLVYKDD